MKNSKKLKNLLISLFCISVFFIGYQAFSSDNFVKMPMYFSLANLPIIKVKIDKKTYPIGIDIGSKFPLSIFEANLKTISKLPSKTLYSSDMFGNSYSTKGYIIPSVEIGKIKWKNLLISEKKESFKNNTTIYCDEKEFKEIKKPTYFGFFGRPILEKTNLYFDFPNSFLITCKNKKSLKKNGIHLINFVKIPFQRDEIGIILTIETELGCKKFVLDTGTTLNCCRASQLSHVNTTEDQAIRKLSYYRTEKFILGGVDFGKEILYSIEITPSLDSIDGFLGMMFLKKHKVYIDYQKNELYISK